MYNPPSTCPDTKEREENNISGNPLKVIFWNINGGFLRKFQEKSLKSFLLTYDIILLTERWLQNEAELSVSGYVVRLLPRKKARCTQGGGIAVLIKEEICHFVSICEVCEDTVLWLKISSVNNEDTYICCFYIPPSCSSYYHLYD